MKQILLLNCVAIFQVLELMPDLLESLAKGLKKVVNIKYKTTWDQAGEIPLEIPAFQKDSCFLTLIDQEAKIIFKSCS